MGKTEIAKLKALISMKKDRIANLKINRRQLGRRFRTKTGFIGNTNTKMMRALIKDQETSLRKLEEKYYRLKAA